MCPIQGSDLAAQVLQAPSKCFTASYSHIRLRRCMISFFSFSKSVLHCYVTNTTSRFSCTGFAQSFEMLPCPISLRCCMISFFSFSKSVLHCYVTNNMSRFSCSGFTSSFEMISLLHQAAALHDSSQAVLKIFSSPLCVQYKAPI